MIGYVSGEVIDYEDNIILLNCNGIGFNVYVPSSVYDSVSGIGDEISLYTYMSVREDAMQLYGFFTKEELKVFKLLISVNGIGPKAGLAILSNMSVKDLCFYVYSDDAKAITKVPGVGLKTAQKLILELKDKMDISSEEDLGVHIDKSVVNNGISDEAVLALESLGYSHTESANIVKKIDITDDMSVEEVIKVALRLIV